MNNDGIFELSLFPIPGCVSFPQTIVPLHVFEPRYRQMVQDCIDKNRLLGVCHTKSIERFGTRQNKAITSEKELFELYKQNLTTYKPEDIFSAGPVDITDTTEDGRYLISIHMLKRFRIIDVIQDTPYKIGRCKEYLDHEFLNFESASPEIIEQKELIVNFLSEEISKQGAKLDKELSDIIHESSVNNFTFKLFRFYRLPEYDMQLILNSQDPIERLKILFNFTQQIKNNLRSG